MIMKVTKYLFLILLMTLLGINVNAQQRNVLQLPDVTTQIGKAQLPISIENTDEIVGAQFDLTLPNKVTAELAGVMTNRDNGHTVTVKRLESGAYRVLIYSDQNRPLRGQSGIVMYLPIIIPVSFEEGSQHTLTISNAVLGKASGENVLTEIVVGKITIAKLPDLTVKNITCDIQTVNPGERIVASWQVENIGDVATSGGWSEQISLVTDDGSNKLIATTHYDGTLNANGIVSRQTEITLAFLLGIDGQAKLQVRIVPDSNTGESTSAQSNNTGTGTSVLTVGKMLSLELSPKRIDENSTTRIALRVNRSGRWTMAETFTLTATADSRISVPESITIPANQSGSIVYLNMTDNDVLDNDSIITISVEGNGYDKASSQLQIDDDEYPSLTIKSSKSVVTEGESFQLTITTSQVSAQPIIVTLNSENSKRFSFPSTVTIPAGETSVTVNVTTVDDELPSLELSNAFTVSAPKYNKGEVIVLLKDNDMPVLELQLTPTTVSEGVGVVAVAGVLRRTTNTNSKITVKLTDDANGGLYFGNRTLELTKGIEEVHFNFGPVDNAQVDGDRTYTITASVWLSSCSCSAAGESAGSVTARLTVLDNDGPALNLTSSLSTVKEGGTAVLTVKRNTTDTSKPLTVTLSSNYEDGLTYDHTVTIPAGQQSATVEVASDANSIQGDSHTVVFTVKADGYATGTCYVMVTDQTLPDIVIENIEVLDAEIEAGGITTVSVTLANRGSAELSAKTKLDFYLQNTKTPFATLYSHDSIIPGETTIVTDKITMPNIVGDQLIFAVVNDVRSIKELSYTNNTSNNISIKLLSPYEATIKSDMDTYLVGDTVTMTGKIDGKNKANTEVEIYLINESTRQSFITTTDDKGNFTFSYVPHKRQMGHFVIGACYPNSGQVTEQDNFEYIGLRRTSQQYVTCDVIVGTPYQGTIQIENPSEIVLHNVLAEIIELPENCEISVAPIKEISAHGKYELNYTINGIFPSKSSEWRNIKFRLISDEGASTEVVLYCYCRLSRAQLSLDIAQLNTTVTKDVPREYPISITNIGAGETGQISLSMPSILRGNTIMTLPSLKPNETTIFTLHLETTDDMQLNVPVTGIIGFNCENGNGIGLPFSLLPVSDTKGKLVVDVCDEYTYYTPEAPHVKGAMVLLKHPYSNKIIAEGVTGDDGTFKIELPEGYYAISVTADKHDSYQNNIIIDPGKETQKVVNLSYDAIKVDWKVEETEVEDEYDIKTTLTYETNVPEPVIITQLPEYIPVDSMAPGESRIYYATLTNKGLIAAESVQLLMPEVEYLTFESLVEFPVRLLPEQSVLVPFKVTLSDNVIESDDDESAGIRRVSRRAGKWRIICKTVTKTIWFHWCGNDHKYHENNTHIPLKVLEECHVKMIERENDDEEEAIGIPNGTGGIFWIRGGGGGAPISTQEDSGCRTCIEILKEKVKDKLIGAIPIIGCWINTIKCSKESIDRAKKDEVGIPDFKTMECQTGALQCALTNICAASSSETIIGPAICYAIGALKNILEALVALTDLKECFWISLEDIDEKSRRRASDADAPSYVKEMDGYSQMLIKQLKAILDYNTELFGDEAWLTVDYGELLVFLEIIGEQNNSPLVESAIAQYVPTNIDQEKLHKFICRMNNTFWGENNDIGGNIDFNYIEECIEAVLNEEQNAKQLNYESTIELWQDKFEEYKNRLYEGNNTVCSSITLQIDQTMTLTRPAYRGTLTVFNGNEETAMTDVRLNLVVKDEDGNVATSREFQINAESLDGFEGELALPGGWTLDGKQTGKTTVLFIPTKYAAPITEKVYLFGGTLSYIDPFTGLEVTRSLIPVSLTVKPMPDLELTYLMQRDVYGDDPLTKDVVEPKEPAEFALIINNKGYGEAKNVRILTEQPKIVDNEKGLVIDFNIKNSQVNGDSATLSFGNTIANDFGTIPAHSQAYGQWWLESSLLGHFTSYKVEATHVTSYDNKDLSLLDTVTIHEMIHGFTVRHDGDKALRGYLVNDIVDAEDMPDIVYFTDATQQGLLIAKESGIIRNSDNEYVLTVNVDNAGWNYGSLIDPTYGKQKLVKVARADGSEINVDNIWQTDRTLRDGRDWLYEHRLHFVGNMPANGETFYLTFEPKPDLELAVESYAGVPEEGTVLKKELTELTVKFNKPIKAESFTTDDMTLYSQGVAQDASKIIIEKQNEQEYKLMMSEVTHGDGYYVLTVQTSGITDNEGFNGSTGKQATWIQFIDGNGIQSIYNEALQVIVMPLPLRDNMYISGNFNRIFRVDIYDIRGAKMVSENDVLPERSIYVGQLNAGIYFIRIATDKGIFSIKVIKR